jgi:hypothetical protein
VKASQLAAGRSLTPRPDITAPHPNSKRVSRSAHHPPKTGSRRRYSALQSTCAGGYTEPSDNPRIRWAGWGYRHIRAKHGWGPTARALTTQALLTTPATEGNYQTYRSPVADRYPNRRGGKQCEWRVVVQRDPYQEPDNPEQSEQAAMGGIITAYGRYVQP